MVEEDDSSLDSQQFVSSVEKQLNMGQHQSPNKAKGVVNYASVLAQGKQDYLDGKSSQKEKKRDVFTREQVELLERHFEENSNWDSDKIAMLSRLMNKKRAKIYKWIYDHKKKLQKNAAAANSSNDP